MSTYIESGVAPPFRVPVSLQRVSERKLVSLLLDKCIVIGMNHPPVTVVQDNDSLCSCLSSCFISCNKHGISWEQGHLDWEESTFDFRGSQVNMDVLLTNNDVKFTKKRRHIISKLREVRDAWEGYQCLGSLPYNLRRNIRRVLSQFIEDSYCIAPIYKTLIQIVFTTDFKRRRMNMRREASIAFTQVVECLSPFSLENVHYSFVSKDSIEPLCTILKNSPLLSTIELHNADHFSDDRVPKEIGNHCLNLKVIVIDFYIEEGNLYDMFFSGMNKNTVIKHLQSKEKMTVSFPFLEVCILNGYWDELFVQILLHFYTNIHIFKCKGEFHECIKLSTLISYTEDFKAIERSPCNLSSLSLDGSCSHLDRNTVNDISKIFPKLDHLSILYYNSSKCDIINKNVKCLLENYSFKSLSLHFTTNILKIHGSDICFTISNLVSNLKELTLYLAVDEYSGILSIILNKCEKLETLLVNCSIGQSTINKYRFSITSPLKNLKTLKVSTCEEYHEDLINFVQILCLNAPNISCLDVNLKGFMESFLSWHNTYPFINNSNVGMDAVAYYNLTSLTLHYSIDAYEQILDIFPSLTTLVIYSGGSTTAQCCRKQLKQTSVEVICGIQWYTEKNYRTYRECLQNIWGRHPRNNFQFYCKEPSQWL